MWENKRLSDIIYNKIHTDLRQIGLEISDWEIDPMEWYTVLKDLEKELKSILDWVKTMIDVENYDLDNLPRHYSWSVQIKKTFNFKNIDDEEYQEAVKIKAEKEKSFKNSYETSLKGWIVYDKNWEAIWIPECKMSEILVLRKKKQL